MVHIPSTIHVCNLFNCSTLTCGKQFVNLTKFNSTPGVLPLVRKSDLMCVLLCILRWYPHSQAYPVLAVRFALTIIHRSSSLYYCQRKPKSESGASLGTRLLKSVVCTWQRYSLHVQCIYIGVLFTVQCYTLCLRLCVVLLVKGSAAYNDSRTDAFRRLARRGIDVRHTTVKFMYIDTLKQATFVAKFNHQPTSLRGCPDGTTATPVSMHALCIWIEPV